jgi:hypothetical protein
MASETSSHALHSVSETDFPFRIIRPPWDARTEASDASEEARGVNRRDKATAACEGRDSDERRTRLWARRSVTSTSDVHWCCCRRGGNSGTQTKFQRAAAVGSQCVGVSPILEKGSGKCEAEEVKRGWDKGKTG